MYAWLLWFDPKHMWSAPTITAQWLRNDTPCDGVFFYFLREICACGHRCVTLPRARRMNFPVIDALRKTCAALQWITRSFTSSKRCLVESTAPISCIVCLFLTTLCRRHSAGPSALINASRREWLFLKMWGWRTCQLMPLYECFGMTGLFRFTMLLFLLLGEMLNPTTLWAMCLHHLELSDEAERNAAGFCLHSQWNAPYRVSPN